MTETLTNPAFYDPALWGALGLVLWLLKTYADPTDDTIHGALGRAILKHSRTLTISIVSYFGLCVALYENEALTRVAAFACGYMNQSLWTAAMDTMAAKFTGKITEGDK